MLSERIRPGAEAAPWVVEEVKRLEADLASARAKADGLAKALATVKDAVWEAHDFLLRECREENPEKGIVVDEGALPTWNLLCDAIAALAALPKEDDHE